MRTLFSLGLLIAAAWLARPASAATFTVNTTADGHSVGFVSQGNPNSSNETTNGTFISLRSALERASTVGGSTTINLPPGTYNLSLGDLVAGVKAGTTIYIHGTGTSANTTIHQTQAHRMVFLVNYNVDANVVFSLDNVTVSGGNEDSSDPDGFGGNGGAMLAGGSASAPGNAVNVTNVVFSGNTANGNATGGAINMTGGGDLNVLNCAFSGNQAGVGGNGGGGAIYFDAGFVAGNVLIQNSTFANNTAYASSSLGLGGAIYLASGNGNPFTISQCTFTGNSAGGRGGAIDLESGHLTASLNRFTGNSAPAGKGSGIFVLSAGNGWADVQNNWWGANGGPTGTGGDSVVTTLSSSPTSSTPPLSNGQVSFNPWIVLTTTASPSSINYGDSTPLTASFLQNSSGGSLTAGQVAVLVGLPVTWANTAHGTLSSQQTTIQNNGQATATFTGGSTSADCGAVGKAEAKVDNVQDGDTTATASITINCPDLTLTKNNNVSGATTLPNGWTWTLHVANSGPGQARYGNGQTLVTDNLPNANVNYGSPSIANASGLTGTVTPGISANNLTCTASGAVTLNSSGSFDVVFTATPTATGPFANPRSAGICAVDPNNNIPETNDGNNSAANTVTVTCPTITATVSGGGAICAGSGSTVTVTVSGGTSPYTITLDNSGGTQTGPSPLTFNVNPASTTTYHVASGHDNNNCAVTPAGSATVTVGSPAITVANANDAGAGSLRQAILDICPGGTITFAAALNGQTITLTSGQLVINKSLTITGPGANLLAVSGNQASRVFDISGVGTAVTISGLRITQGAVSNPVNNEDKGGGIRDVNGTLTLLGCSVVSNNAGEGAGLWINPGNVTILNSTIASNSATADTGGVIVFPGSTLSMVNSTIAYNTGAGNCGGLSVGPGVVAGITNCTIAHNTASSNGGGILSVLSSTTLKDTIVALNTAATAPDYLNTFTSAGYNLIGNNSGTTINSQQPSDQVGTSGSPIDPMLGALGNNGGPTPTLALLASSPAIDAGDPAFDPNAFSPPLNNDQRGAGFPRVFNNRVDIGAFELSSSVVATGGFTVTGPEGTALSSQTVATFTDSTGPDLVGNYSATINWGDATATSAGTITLSGSTFTVKGAHTYAEEGSYTITVTITHSATFPVTATSTATIAEAQITALTGAGATQTIGEGASTAAITGLATFTDPAGAEPVADYAVTIHWGDGATSAGTVVNTGGNNFRVDAPAHTYAEEGSYTVSVDVKHDTAATLTVTGATITVNDLAVSATGGFTVAGTAGVAFSGQTVATFTDPGGAEALADYSATINWGDGSPASTGSITFAAGTFTVAGSHTYALGGSYTISVTIQHDLAADVTVTSGATISTTCPTITATVSGGGAICPGGSATVTVAVSGGAAPYSITLDHGGGTQNGNGPSFNFSVAPATTTTYHVASGHDNNNCSVTGSGSATVTSNAPPIAGSVLLGTTQNTAVNAPVAKMLASASSPINGTLSITAVSPTSSQGGTVSLGGGFVTYTPPNNFFGTDIFTYTLSDTRCTAQGTVTVTVTSTNAQSLNLISIVHTDSPSANVVSFAGIPGQYYVIQWAATVTGPWTDLSGPIPADATGLITYTDTRPPSPRFYRTHAANR